MKKPKMPQEILMAELCSGAGQYHSDEPGAKKRKLYSTVSLSKIREMIEAPGSVSKEKALWVIPSTRMTRTHSEQRDHGSFMAAWCDIDNSPPPTIEGAQRAAKALGCQVWAYSTRSATSEKPKARYIIPYALPVPGADHVLFQKIINDKLETMGVQPDRATERAGQLCYLPNRGEHYEHIIIDRYPALDPYTAFAGELEAAKSAEQARLDTLRRSQDEARRKAQARVDSGEMSPIDAYTAEHSIELALDTWGATRRGNKWLSPLSGSRAAGIKLIPGSSKARSHHQSDADAGLGRPCDGGGVIFDAFDLYCFQTHGNDRTAAVAEIGRMLRRGNPGPIPLYSGAKPSADTDTGTEDSTTAAGTDYSSIKRPCYITWPKGFTDAEGRRRRPGLYHHTTSKPGKKDETPRVMDTHICTPIRATAITSDGAGTGWGLMLEVMNPDGGWREFSIPMDVLRGSGEDLRGVLLDLGHRLDPKKRSEFATWLTLQYPKARIIAANSTGWHGAGDGRAFVLPERVLGAQNVRYQSHYHGHHGFSVGGTYEGWRENIAMKCIGNPLAILSLSAALAGPLIRLAQLKQHGGAGIHYLGDSSTGKTTLLQVGASVWGDASFVRTWRATANGLEATANLLNDTVLCIDEISQSDPKEIGNVIYCLANGHGKQRAKRTGGARDSFRWRIFVMSSGERSISGHMSETPGRRAKAGQEVRLLDIPVARKYGCYDALHGYLDGRAFCDSLKSAVATDYGHAGPMFIEQLMADTRDLPGIQHSITHLPEFSGKSSIEGRAAATLALVAMAGELATEYGICPWEPGDAIDAAATALESWRAYRGAGQSEQTQILRDVREFIIRHGDSRFSDKSDDQAVIRDRAGYTTEYPQGRAYLMHAGALREACPGMDLARILDALDTAGWLIDKPSDGKQRAKPFKIGGRPIRLYAVCPSDERDGVEVDA